MFTAWRKAWSVLAVATFAALFAPAPARATIPRHTPDAAAVSLLAASENRGTCPETIAPGTISAERPERARRCALYLVETQRGKRVVAVELVPEVVEWLIRDPLGEAGGINLTAFCANDPMNQVDPLGLKGCQQNGPTFYMPGNSLTPDPSSDNKRYRVAESFYDYSGAIELETHGAGKIALAGVTMTAGTGLMVVGGEILFPHVLAHLPAISTSPWVIYGAGGFTWGVVESIEYDLEPAEAARTIAIDTVVAWAFGYASGQVQPSCSTASDTVTVTRWGRPGLRSGDWVMLGGKNWWNYTWSGKWQPSWLYGNNIPAPFPSGASYPGIPRGSVRPPRKGDIGTAEDNWLTLKVKELLNQRVYDPPE